MTKQRVAAVTGAGAILAYLGLTLVSGHLSILARRPLLDGGGTPPLYRWVCPPADFASVNQPAKSLSETIDFGKSEHGAGLHSTSDRQAEFVVDPGTFLPADARGKGKLRIDASCLDSVSATAPPGMTVTGNVYKITLVDGTGKSPKLSVPAHLVLFYPTPTGTVFISKHTLVRLGGSAWEALKTTDSPATQQATSDVTELGTFAVAFTATTPPPSPRSGGGSSVGIISGAAVGAVVAVTAVVLVLRARKEAARRRARLARRGKGRGQPPRRR